MSDKLFIYCKVRLRACLWSVINILEYISVPFGYTFLTVYDFCRKPVRVCRIFYVTTLDVLRVPVSELYSARLLRLSHIYCALVSSEVTYGYLRRTVAANRVLRDYRASGTPRIIEWMTEATF